MDLRARLDALVAASTDDVSGDWDPSWHIGPIEDRTDAERAAALAWIEANAGDLEWLHGRLADDASRETLVRLLAHRILGSRRIALGPGRETAERLTELAEHFLAAEPTAEGLPRFDLDALGMELEVVAAPMFAIHTFLLEQYRHPEIAEANARAGDVVVDGGAFWGDTALWLAEQVAPDGRVVAFEPDPAGRSILEVNLRANPRQAARIEVRTEALWHSDSALELTPQGAATTVGEGRDDVRGISLDSLLRRGELPRVDFVKLDVEGAELSALRGMSDALRERPPRLAVAVYHRPEDLVTIPRFLDSANLGYRLALTHRSLHQFDTMLFAWPG